MSPRRDVEIQIEFVSSEHGAGRLKPVHSGYRPQLYYDGHDWDANHEYPDAQVVHPGDRTRAYLVCLSPQYHDGKLVPGKAVLFREGLKVVAFGVVTRVIDLPEFAYRARLHETVEPYYLQLAAAADAAVPGRERDVLLSHMETTARFRSELRLGVGLPDVQSFLADALASISTLSHSSAALTDKLSEIEKVAQTLPILAASDGAAAG